MSAPKPRSRGDLGRSISSNPVNENGPAAAASRRHRPPPVPAARSLSTSGNRHQPETIPSRPRGSPRVPENGEDDRVVLGQQKLQRTAAEPTRVSVRNMVRTFEAPPVGGVVNSSARERRTFENDIKHASTPSKPPRTRSISVTLNARPSTDQRSNHPQLPNDLQNNRRVRAVLSLDDGDHADHVRIIGHVRAEGDQDDDDGPAPSLPPKKKTSSVSVPPTPASVAEKDDCTAKDGLEDDDAPAAYLELEDDPADVRPDPYILKSTVYLSSVM